MNSQFIVHLAILLMVIIASLRIFLSSRIELDGLSFFAPGALLCAASAVFVWGLSPSLCILLILSSVLFICNLRPLLQFIHHISHRSFSAKFCFVSFILLISAIAFLVLIIYLYPQDPPAQIKGVSERTIALTGTLNGGISERKMFSQPITGKLAHFISKNTTEQQPVLLSIPDIRSGIVGMHPLYTELAKRGYEVIAAELYTQDGSYFSGIADRMTLRRFTAQCQTLFANNRYILNNDFYIIRSQSAYQALLNLYADKLTGRKIFLIGESYSQEAVSVLTEKDNRIAGYFCINGIDSNGNTFELPNYQQGYACISQSDPLFAAVLNGTLHRSPLLPSALLADQIQQSVTARLQQQ